MMHKADKKNEAPETTDQASHIRSYRRLFRNFTLLTVICSLIPLLLVGWGINAHFADFARERMIKAFEDRIDSHRRTIELFLKERSDKLRLIAYTHTKGYLSDPENLKYVYAMFNSKSPEIRDLGVIDAEGDHLAYAGPYDLLDKNYSQAKWFAEVMDKDLYISDMFMGFRKKPHFIMAVARSENGSHWILRATIDTDYFRSLVENVKIGQTGEVYLVNKNGVYQTEPRGAPDIMDHAAFQVESAQNGVGVHIYKGGGQKSGFSDEIVGTAWLEKPRWLLVVKQDYAEAFADVNHANNASMLFLLISALTILVVTVLSARLMIRMIKKRDIQAEYLNKQLMQTGKMASIGELSAGVAHEINNPIAIIQTERQILLDYYNKQKPMDSDAFRAQLLDSMDQIDIQAQRCKRITQNLLRFSRRTRSIIESVDLNRFIGEVIELMEREARTSGIKFIPELENGMPPIESDPSQLQQVFLNLITNAIDAHEEKSYGSIRITSSADHSRQGVYIRIADTGAGISEENLEKIFDPFFTTKAVGKGTGLGLSICYSIVKQLGGDISVSSRVGEGTEFTLFLPFEMPEAVTKGEGSPGENQTPMKKAI